MQCTLDSFFKPTKTRHPPRVYKCRSHDNDRLHGQSRIWEFFHGKKVVKYKQTKLSSFFRHRRRVRPVQAYMDEYIGPRVGDWIEWRLPSLMVYIQVDVWM